MKHTQLRPAAVVPASITVLAAVALLAISGTEVAGASGSGEYGYGYGDEQERERHVITLELEDMNGPLAAVVVESALETLQGVYSAEVSHEADRATVEVMPGSISEADIVRFLQEWSPFSIRVLPRFARSATIRIDELTTARIGEEVNAVLSEVPGVLGGTIRPGIAAVDYDSRVTDAEKIGNAIAEQTSLTASDITVPAADRPAPEDSAQTILRIPTMRNFSDAIRIGQAVSLEGIMDGSVNIDDKTITFIYVIGELTTPQIVEAVEAEVSESTEIITIDKAGKPAGLNIHGWFVLAVSTLGLAVLLGGYFLLRHLRRRNAPTA